MAKIKVEYDMYCDSYDSGEEWGEWRRTCDTTVTGLSTSKKKDFYDFDTDFDTEPGQELYLVWGNYNSGDSFGHESGKPEFVELFDDYDKACDFAKALRLHYEWCNYKDNYEYRKLSGKQKQGVDRNMDYQVREVFDFAEKKHEELDTDDYKVTYHGKTYFIPWNGYFESLNDIHVDALTLDTNKSRKF